MKTSKVAGCLLALAGATAAGAAAGAAPQDVEWVGSWGASPQLAAAPLSIQGATIREFAHLSLGGQRLRVRLSNAYGAAPVVIGSTHLALRGAGASILAGTDRPVTFHGRADISIPAGGQEVSDPVDLAVPDLGDVAISLYVPGAVTINTEHTLGQETTYVSASGDFSASPGFAPASTTQSIYFAADIEVARHGNARAIVALGDSITDGYHSTVDANHRWPDYLAQRLAATPGLADTAVVDEGISGNRVLTDFIGTNAIARLDRDGLVKSRARYLIVLEGINDIGIPGLLGDPTQEVSAEQIIGGYEQIIRRAHALGLRVYGGTLTPFFGTTFPGYYSAAGEVKREAVNAWIRNKGAFDAVIDFDAAVRDPQNPTHLLPAYDSGDNLHPNDAGYQAMANAIDLSLFAPDR